MYWCLLGVYYYFLKHTVLLYGVTIYGALMRDVASASSSFFSLCVLLAVVLCPPLTHA